MKGFDDVNAFAILGLPQDADEQQVRQAYHQRVKECHPDQFEGEETQRKAQDQLVQLNLAYEEALRLAGNRRAPFHAVSPEEAKQLARKLLAQQRYESALLQLSHANTRDGEWYFIHGEILMGMHQYSTAHQSFREAVRLDPENNKYRLGALDAALAVKKRQKWTYRAAEWAKDLLHRTGKK